MRLPEASLKTDNSSKSVNKKNGKEREWASHMRLPEASLLKTIKSSPCNDTYMKYFRRRNIIFGSPLSPSPNYTCFIYMFCSPVLYICFHSLFKADSSQPIILVFNCCCYLYIKLLCLTHELWLCVLKG